MRKTIQLPELAAVFLFGALLGFGPVFAGGAEVVDENTADWAFAEEVANGSGSYTYGPGASSVLGEGAAFFSVDDTGRQLFGTDRFNTVPLSQFTGLSYSTFRVHPVDGVIQLSLQINIDYDVTDKDVSWQGRLVYEPYLSGTVQAHQWQTWDALAGEWWSSGSPGNGTCPQNDPCTWAEVLTAFPNAGVHNAELGAILLKAGGPWTGGFKGFADALVINTAEANSTFDFETAFGIFGDGFESADVSAWSSSIP